MDRVAARGYARRMEHGEKPGEPERWKRAIVTGGAVRVGRFIALALAREGYQVAIHFHASEDAASSTAEEIRTLASTAGRGPLTLQADLRDPAAIESLFQRIDAEWGGLDLLVNSAAAFPRGRPEQVTVEEWERTFALNLRAPFLCAREAARLMGDGGAVINIVDVAAFEAWPAYVPYAASKAGLVSVTRGLARAWAPRIRVNAVAPGAVLMPEGATADERQAAAARSALRRVGSPADVAGAVLYLARAPYVTGEVLRVDGGAHLMRSVWNG